jgi:hypothetical protein
MSITIIIIFIITLPACLISTLTILKRDMTHSMRGHPTAKTATVTCQHTAGDSKKACVHLEADR